MRVFLVGWYGLNNVGAESLLKVYKNLLKDHEVIYTSWGQTKNSVSPYDIKSNINEIKNSDLILYGGGDLISGIKDGLLFWFWRVRIAKIFQKKVVISSVSSKKLSLWDRTFVHFLLKKVDIITARDTNTQAKLKQCGINSKRTYDSTVLIREKKASRKYKIRKNSLFIILHPFYHQKLFNSRVIVYSPSLLERLIKMIKRIKEIYDFEIYLITFHNDEYLGDYPIVNILKSHLEFLNMIDTKNLEPEEIKYIISKFKLGISFRFHGCVFALDENVPVIGINLPFTERVRNVMNDNGLGHLLVEKKIKDIDKTILEKIDYTLENYYILKKKISKKRKRNKELVREEFKLLREIMET